VTAQEANFTSSPQVNVAQTEENSTSQSNPLLKETQGVVPTDRRTAPIQESDPSGLALQVQMLTQRIQELELRGQGEIPSPIAPPPSYKEDV
jgi:hypothetical protein